MNCIDCGKQLLTKTSTRCHSCANIAGATRLPWLVERLSQPFSADECVEWPFAKDRGYGSVGKAGKNVLVTHIALESAGLSRPPAPNNQALHSCDNPPCINPSHLRWGSHAENMADKVSRQRQSHARRPPKTTEHEVRVLFALSRLGFNDREVGEMVGLSPGYVWKVRTGASWGHLNLVEAA